MRRLSSTVTLAALISSACSFFTLKAPPDEIAASVNLKKETFRAVCTQSRPITDILWTVVGGVTTGLLGGFYAAGKSDSPAPTIVVGSLTAVGLSAVTYGLVRNRQCRGAAADFNQYLDSHPEAEAKLVAEYREQYEARLRRDRAQLALDLALIAGVGYVFTKGITAGSASRGETSNLSQPAQGTSETEATPAKSAAARRSAPEPTQIELREPVVDKCAPVREKRPHNRGKTKGYEFRCPKGNKAYVWWSTERSHWVGDSNYATQPFDGVGYRDTPEAAASWECGCKE